MDRREFFKGIFKAVGGGLIGYAAMKNLGASDALASMIMRGSGGGACATCSGEYGNNSTSKAYAYGSEYDDQVTVRISLGCNGTITDLYFYTYNVYNVDGYRGAFALYADNGSGTAPGNLINSYGTTLTAAPGGSDGWARMTISEAIADCPDYVWLSMQGDYSTRRFYYSATTGGVAGLVTSVTVGTFANPHAAFNDTNTFLYDCYLVV